MPVVPVPVSKTQEYELQEYTNEGNSNSELNTEWGAPCKDHSPDNDRCKGQYNDPQDPENWQEIYLNIFDKPFKTYHCCWITLASKHSHKSSHYFPALANKMHKNRYRNEVQKNEGDKKSANFKEFWEVSDVYYISSFNWVVAAYR